MDIEPMLLYSSILENPAAVSHGVRMSRTGAACFAAWALVAAGPAASELTAQTGGAGAPLTAFDPAKDAGRIGQAFLPYGVRPDRAVAVSAGVVTFDLGARRDAGHVGVKAKSALSGDFSVEFKYELSAAPDRADDGYGVTLGVSVQADHKTGGASAARGFYKADGQQYSAGRSLPRAKGVHYASRHFPTAAKSGRLAIRRLRDEVIVLAADSPSADWLELQRYPFTNAPVQTISLYADTGGAAAVFKGRIYDISVMTGSSIPTGDYKRGPVGTTIVPLPDPLTEPYETADAADVSAIPITGPASAGIGARGWWWIPVLTFVLGLAVGVYSRRLFRTRPGRAG